MMEYLTISDSIYDKQPGVYNAYYDKNDWICKTIERLGEKGWELHQRLPGECMIFKREKKEGDD